VAAPAGLSVRGREAFEATRGILRGGRILALVLLAAPVCRAWLDRAGAAPIRIASFYAGVAIALWAVATFIQGRLLLGRQLQHHAARGNGAAAVATAANQIAIALVVSRAVAGDEVVPALVFAVLGIVTWAVFVALFRMVTTYPDGQEIAGENHAAAVSYGGAAVALGLVIGHAVDGTFAGWGASLGAYGRALALAAALYPVRQLVVEGLLLGQRPRLRGGELDRAIGQRRSVGVAAVEAAAYVATALLATGLG
jgi:uncharacterized membrane protein YjfL (UPF0719 family)